MAERPVVKVVGGGLAGAEAVWTLARLGLQVQLFEMRPTKMTPAHRTANFAELVCSNSLGGEGPTTAKSLVHAELRTAGSLVMDSADRFRVPAGLALAVDREPFSAYITEKLSALPRVEVIREEITEIPEPIAILATGPLTSDLLAEALRRRLGDNFLYFYDAAAPVILGETINMEKCFLGGRFEQTPDYINCPMSEEEYHWFYTVLTQAREHTPHNWENLQFFEGCVPIEELARRGYLTPVFGPLRPVGIIDPRTGKEPFAVVQLRQEDRERRLWSLVGFQTGLRWPDQIKVVRAIPGLENAEIVRYGVMHRNTYLNAPKLLQASLELRDIPGVFVAGVLAGVEGYVESAATGFLAGLNAGRLALGLSPVIPPPESMLGALVRFLAEARPENFQPMSANWGLVPPLGEKMDKKANRKAMFHRGRSAFEEWFKAVWPKDKLE